MSFRFPVVALALLALLASGCGSARDEGEILVFAASSLADVAPELGEVFSEETGIAVNFNFGSPMALARQIAAGVPADLLIAADLAAHPLVVNRMPSEGAYLNLVSNELVLVTPVNASWPAQGLRGVGRVAVGDWRADVPVGLRARDWLRAEGSWGELEERLVPCVDARATLAAVASGSVQAGIVYSTDAASSTRVRIVKRAGPRQHSVTYVAFELQDPPAPAHDFLFSLLQPAADAVFHRHGFVIEGTVGRTWAQP